ncbi:hypothetical protein, partial [Pantoea sp. Ae16]|uniref:hypothetical protein n=1 Tax=Pantoea sp. Ae16 TaxID=1890373 RepID=UPI001C31A8CB
LLKSGAASAQGVCCEVAYITLSSSGVNHFFQRFLRRGESLHALLSPSALPLCRLSGGAL